MDKYDEIISRLSASADRKRTMAQIKAQAEIDAINREYAAYVDGVDDAIRQIRAVEEKAWKGGSNE